MKLWLTFPVLSFLTAVSGARNDKVCQGGYLNRYPFFGDDSETPMRFKAQQMAFLIEFSRFMNLKAPTMLKVSLDTDTFRIGNRRYSFQLFVGVIDTCLVNYIL